MVDSPFRRVMDAVASSPESVLVDEGVSHARNGSSFQLDKEWNTGFLCPLGCGDTNGSASFHRTGRLRCHQCDSSHDLFDWLARVNKTDAWTECKRIGEKLGVSLKTKKLPGGRSMPKRMTNDVMQSAIIDLLENPAAESIRKFLDSRKLFHRSAIATLGLGHVRGYLVFPQFDEKGGLLERYRGYAPGQKQPWLWFGEGTGGPGAWPAQRAPADGDKILLLEGEWDVLTALIRLRLHRQGWTPVTFTSGAGAHPEAHAIPSWFHGREVHVAYDNDTFQGPKLEDYFILTKGRQTPDHARAALFARLSNLVDKIGPLLESFGCDVHLRACPIDPRREGCWGADLRDWVDQGGRDFNDWHSYRLDQIDSVQMPVESVPFDEAFTRVGRRIRTIVQVDSISNDDVLIPTLSKIDCPKGSDRACNNCRVPRDFPDQIIDWSRYPRELAMGLHPSADKNYLKDNVIQPARGCPRCELVTLESQIGSSWGAARPATNLDGEANRQMQIISDRPPSLTGDVEITGTVYATEQHRAFMRVDKLHSLDREEVDLRPFVGDFHHLCPWQATRVEEIDEYLTTRWRDFAHHVTKIHGRRDLSIVHDLMTHSVTDFRLRRNEPQRGWLDACVFGSTRTGKSVTFEAMLHYHGLGLIHTAVSNASRAGIVMGTDKTGQLRPGLFPRCHRKLLVLDEWHFLVQNEMKRDNPSSWIQSARGSGYASSAKISGVRRLPAKVRFLTIANWIRGDRHTYEFDCEHLIGLYETPEAIARLDFALSVHESPSQNTTDVVDHFWTADRTRALIMRAWAQSAEQVHIEPEAIRVAEDAVELWRHNFDTERIPLFTPEEKTASLLRIAIAVANVCFSHPEDSYADVLVRPVHVRWAAHWIEHTWRNNQYRDYSMNLRRREAIVQPLAAERHVTVALGLEDASAAEVILGQLLQPFTMPEAFAIVGKGPAEGSAWISRGISLRLFKKRRMAGSAHVEFAATKAGHELLARIIGIASYDPAEYVDRFSRLDTWNPDSPDPLDIEGLVSDGSDVSFTEVPF